VILADHEEIGLEDLPESIRERKKTIHTLQMTIPEEGIPFNAAVEEYERQLILQALDKTNWVKKKAAELLNINRTTLVEKIKKKNIVRSRAN
jgi:DNA-binding NtrC family response regulator